MKKLTFLLFALLLIIITANSQSPCLPEGITFTTQEQIDNFQIYYPGCTEIEGDVTIHGDGITNLNGLNVLTSIMGNLRIGFYIYGNLNLTSFAGLNNLTFVGGRFEILDNDAITSLAGLENLTNIGGDLWIAGNLALVSLTGLQSLSSIGGGLYILSNDALTSLTGLESLAAINGIIWITYNTLLSNCDMQFLCNYLLNPTGSINIFDNAPGCNNPPELAANCGFTMPCMPFGNYYFFYQAEIDSFQSNYPGCTELNGSTMIGRINTNQISDITNLDGLSGVTSIAGNLSFNLNLFLTDLSGLDNLSFISESLHFYGNAALAGFSGLESLTTIGGWLSIEGNHDLTSLMGLDNLNTIGDLYIYNNSALTSLTGMENLSCIEGFLSIGSNPVLSSLAGLENIDGVLLDSLDVTFNPLLSYCEVKSICDYLSTPDSSISIHDNAPGCNSPEEVQEACLTSIKDNSENLEFTISPNPVTGFAELSLNSPGSRHIEISLINTTGIRVKSWQYPLSQTAKNHFILDLKELPMGVYFCRVAIGSEIATCKVVKY